MKKNPFDIPNMGLNQDNPLFTSMTMMRQMWEDMAGGSMGLSASATAMPSVEDLDKRIKDLRAVENWLRLNLSMLSSTIQGLEIQRSTLSTLQSFTGSGLAAMPGLAEAMAQATQTTTGQPDTKDDQSTADTSADNTETNESLMQAGQAWWGLMQQQFDTLAQATTQSMQQAQTVAENISATVANPSADTTFGKNKATVKKATKTAAKKATAKKATKAAKTAAKKTS